MLLIFIVKETRQQIVWLLKLQVLSPLLGGIRLLLLFLVLLQMIWWVCQILDFVSFVGSLVVLTRYSFSPFKVFPIGFFLEGVLMRLSWGLSTMVLFWQNHLDSLWGSYVLIVFFAALCCSCFVLVFPLRFLM